MNILSCIFMESIIMEAFTYLFPSAGLPRRTSSSSTYFVCSWLFQVFAVVLFYFHLEAVNTMHITKLQTFSTGNRTLKREVLFHYIAKKSQSNKKTRRGCGLTQNGLCHSRSFCTMPQHLLYMSETSL